MSDLSSHSDVSVSSEYSSDDSEYNYIPGYLAIEAETHTRIETEDDPDTGPYSNEPLADEEWTRDYIQRQEEKKKRMLRSRLEGIQAAENW